MKTKQNSENNFSSRWHILTNRKLDKEQRIFAGLELFCFPASIFTVLVLLPFQIAASRCGWSLPAWVHPVINVLLSAAVGYITNYIAIEMLFKPYVRNRKHPLSLITMGYWKQGLIPKNKNKIGDELGKQIETKLLNPEKLADELCDMVMSLTQSPDIITEVRTSVQKLLHTYQKNITEALQPQIEKEIYSAAGNLFTQDKIRGFWKAEVEPFLQKEEHRNLIAGHIIKRLQDRSPELTAVLKTEVQEACFHYLEKHLPFGFGAEPLAEGLVNFIEWNDIQNYLSDKLGEKETSDMLQEELQSLIGQVNKWLQSPEISDKINGFIIAMKTKLQAWLHEYLQKAIPSMINSIIDSEKLWNWIEHDLLPASRPQIEAFIRKQGKDKVIAKLNLSRRISEAVEKQDVKEFHEMINSIAAQHLGAIQVLGYILGLVIGLLQLFV